MKKTLFLLAALLLVSADIFAQPGWIKSGQDGRYPQDLYFTGAGIAPGRRGLEAAREKARAEIAAQIKVTVTSKYSNTETEKVIGDTWAFASDLKSTTESVIDNVELKGVTYPDSYFSESDNSMYVLAVMDRSEFFGSYKKEIDGLLEQASEKLDLVHKLQSEKDMGGAAAKLVDLLSFIEPIYPKIIFYNSISPKTYRVPDELKYDNVEMELIKMVDNFSLKIISGDGQTGRTGSYLPEQLKVQVLYSNNGEAVPLKGIPVAFKNNTKVFDKKYSDQDGFASYKCFVNADMIKPGNMGEVDAAVSLPVLRGRLKEKMEKSGAQKFQFQLSNKTVTCAVEIKGQGSDKAQLSVMKKVVAALEKNGAVINQNEAGYLARIVVTAADGGSVSGLTGDMLMQNVDLSIVLIDKKTGDVIGTISASAKGVDKNAGAAVEKGIQNLKVPYDKISELIGKINL
ncbi:MAG: LPP20 family lipoprotein [Syntrophothermus sp.]